MISKFKEMIIQRKVDQAIEVLYRYPEYHRIELPPIKPATPV